MNRLKTFLKYVPLLNELVKRDLKVKYRRSVLGFIWSLLNPLLMMMVISAVFSAFFRFDIPNFPIYLLCGQVMFTFFSEATNTSMSSIIAGSSLIKKVYIPKYIFPLSRTLSSLVNLLFALFAIVIMLVITGTPVKATVLLFWVPIVYVFLFATGMGMFLSVLAVFFRDMVHLYGVLLTAWMYFTPIFYPAKLLTENENALIRMVTKWNPLYHFVGYFREVILYGTLPSLKENLLCLSFGLVAVALGVLVMFRQQDKFILHV